MSRHRSPGGRGARSMPRASHHRATAAVRNGLAAAAVAAGAVAVLTVAVTTGAEAGATSETATLRLTADGQTAAPAAAREGVALPASIVPVRDVSDAEPPEVDVAELLKAAGLGDVARRADEERAARKTAADCDVDLDGLGPVKPWVRDAARLLSCLYDQPPLIGVAQRSRTSDHPSGHAADLLVRGDQGDRIAECALANQEELGITYVIWKQRVNYGDGWERMPDRGGDTENHYDHVHISFEKSPPDGDPVTERCH